MAVPRSRSGNHPATALLPAGVPVATGTPRSRNTTSNPRKPSVRCTASTSTPEDAVPYPMMRRSP